MKKILNFIINHCLFLFEKYGFRFIDSLYSKSFGGDAYITLESEIMKIRFTLDRGQFFIDFASSKKHKSSWYSIDLISQFITGRVELTSVIDSHYTHFFVENMAVIYDYFSEENVEETLNKLTKLAKERAKRLFD